MRLGFVFGHVAMSQTDFLRKEVIQPQVPLRLPCYDLVPITKLAFGAAFLTVRQATSGTLGFRFEENEDSADSYHADCSA